MFLVISNCFIIISILFLWMLLISTKNLRTNKEQYIEIVKKYIIILI